MSFTARSATRHTDQFDWFSAYIDDRGLRAQWRVMTCIFTGSLAALPLVLLTSPAGPDHSLTVVASIVSAAVGCAGALLWLLRWPTRRQSVFFCLASTVSIALTCLAQSDPYTGLMGCTTFAVIGGFVAFFHTLELLVINLAAAIGSAAITTYRLIHSTDDLATAGSALLIVTALNLGTPFGIYTLAHALRSDLRSAGHDALTGLLNRRSFHHAAYELLMHSQDRGGDVVVTMIDLDRFKVLNDTRGHSVGDQALVAVGAALRQHSRHTTVIGRIGGEEFVIADVGDAAELAHQADEIRAVIAANPLQITASIGTASAPLRASATKTAATLIEDLIHEADLAMYEAKRAGGNQVRHSEPGPVHGR